MIKRLVRTSDGGVCQGASKSGTESWKKLDYKLMTELNFSVSCEVSEEWLGVLKNEVLAEGVARDENYEYDEIAKVSGQNVTISLEKV